MLTHNQLAFKEWAVICAALGRGRQSLILRKGGIQEGRSGFQVEHSEFWLFPTNFHQSADDLAESTRPLWDEVRLQRPPDDQIVIRHYAVVEHAAEIVEESLLPRLAGLHGWSDRVIYDRFHYKRPGLFALLVRVYELPSEVRLPNLPLFAGCRSWVDLAQELSTARLRPVLSDTEHAARRDEIVRRLSETS